MKAVILAGGEGTRLRPLTLSLPKPVVPVVDRPFLRHQLDMLARAGVTEVIFSVAYRPERIRDVFGNGSAEQRIRYLFEETPLGTGGAVKNAETELDGTTLVLNGDVLTDVDLGAVVKRHVASGASATLVLTPVADPSAYGLVECDARGHVTRFREKPLPEEITPETPNTINAGIYVLETGTLGLMPVGEPHSIERGFFPNLLARGDDVVAHVHKGYWIDIGTPDKYLQVHEDILHQTFPLTINGDRHGKGWVHPGARLDPGAHLEGPFYVGPGCEVAEGAHLGPGTTLVKQVHVDRDARISHSVIWQDCHIGEQAQIEHAILGPSVTAGRNSRIVAGAVIGEGSVLGDFSRTS